MECNVTTTYRSWKVAEPRCCETQFASFNEAADGDGARVFIIMTEPTML